jgi:hypothetical protein
MPYTNTAKKDTYRIKTNAIIDSSMDNDVIEITYNKDYLNGIELNSTDYDLVLNQLYNKVSLANYDVRFIDNVDPNVQVFANKETMLKLIDSQTYQLSIIINDSYLYESTMNELKSLGYRVIDINKNTPNGIYGFIILLDSIVKTFVTLFP